ncbi:uncharacterized protein KIAA0040-like [Xenopus laevis]|uniref:Uncharacterized protein KIAA0040-like n=2 Tax=Xenopus laevis TaxID=8355 RepID=A0A1L8GG14_XENLA|nr:uncharacterized protein KIAA0040-like [Xenopus laevis]XP_041417429.1 uncharacterized protein KIAA0040-like [Xenopus laevis]XP_041417430.1 uncharacterized protein KIAA0040-like [Xenopus laevis]OCT82783.1 hypothetical protein XELAEV_18025317mg [Xenopus laevis]
MDNINSFFLSIYDMLKAKHEEGIYNTVCLSVLLALPLLTLLILSIVCCHCCCCRTKKRQNIKYPAGKKKKGKKEEEDLWIPSPQNKSLMLEKIPPFSV